jgi:MutS domain V
MSSVEVAEVSEEGVGRMDDTSVFSSYSNRLSSLRTELGVVQAARHRSVMVMAGCLCVGVLMFGLVATHHAVALVWWAVPLLGVGYGLRRYLQSGARWREIERRCDYFERGLRRLTAAWQGEGRTGEEFAREGHLYQSDLNVIGEGSLFELLCTPRSEFGAERLADYLLESVSLEESRRRQEAVRELREGARLREEMDLLGDFRAENCGSSVFEAWLDLPPIASPGIVRSLLLLSSACTLLIGLGIFSHALAWGVWLPFMLVLIAMHLAAAGFYLRRVRPRLGQLRRLTNAFTILQQGLALMEKQEFQSPKLREMVIRVQSQKASPHLKVLERLIRLVEQREKEMFHYLSYLLAGGTQLVLAVDHWRSEYQQHFRGWVDAWAEFEALHAFAGYAFEQPGTVFPELVDGDAVFEAVQMGHPLLNSERCVCNDIALNAGSRFYLITGSNMAGKSTMLRTVGLNTVIALAGGPVRAARARLSRLTVCASLAVTDSLLEGKSKFLAEVARLSESIELSRSGEPVLFLIDEILSGTNSKDRSEATEAVVRMLIRQGAVGAVSTHDLALSRILDDASVAGVLVHMESDNPDDPLDFDYLLKPGVSRKSNAWAIVRMMGIGDLDELPRHDAAHGPKFCVNGGDLAGFADFSVS